MSNDLSLWNSQPPLYTCPSPNHGLSRAIRENDYNGFIKTFGDEVRKTGKVDIDLILVTCHGECPIGCKFKMKLGKSITKKSFERMYKHGKKYNNHCLNVKFEGNIYNDPFTTC